MKEVRFNANPENSKRLKELQRDHQAACAPARISLAALANNAIALGLQPLRERVLRPANDQALRPNAR
jgi:hypothetical protein